MNFHPTTRLQVRILLLTIFVVSICAITYELLIGALTSYLSGDSVTQFSVTIGLFLSSMGLGSWLSRFVKKRLLAFFIDMELTLALLGGMSLILLNSAYHFTKVYTLLFVLLTTAIGILIGLEIPVITRIIRRYGSIRTVLSNVLAFDYMGGLAGSLLFPFLLLPYFGLIRTSFMTGLLNLAVVVATMIVFRKQLLRPLRMGLVVLCGILLIAALIFALPISSFLERELYQGHLLYSKQSAFQKIVITGWKQDIRLYLDGSLQFSSVDERRYHEALVHGAAAHLPRLENALVLGGGDGLAVRELLRYPGVRRIVLVDIDPVITDLARRHPLLLRINGGSLADPRVEVINGDAFKYLEKNGGILFDLIIADFPDPHNATLSKLYSREFYRMAGQRLSRGGALVTQSSSPFFSREAFWIINHTLTRVFPFVRPYHVYVPSFGDWGFNLATRLRLQPNPDRLPPGLTFLDGPTLRSAFVFPRDTRRPATTPPVNTLNDPLLAAAYAKGWKFFQ